MILPTKNLRADQSLLYVGAEVLLLLSEAKTVSRLWEELNRYRNHGHGKSAPISYDWFVLSLDLLCLMGAIELERGLLRKTTR